jgi:hypothetical protein
VKSSDRVVQSIGGMMAGEEQNEWRETLIMKVNK